MNKMIVSLLLFLVVAIANLTTGQSMERVAGHVLYRHGDRTPIQTFPTDKYKEADWPNGFGQLTAIGIEQQHRLGQFIRDRYNSLLNTTYVAREFVVRSTDVDRTLMSAQSNLAGLYPSTNLTDGRVPIQPIPIHTVSVHTDFLLGQNDCPRYDQLEEEVNESDEMKQLNEKYAPFFQQLSIWTGLKNITVYNAWDIADTVYVESKYNRVPEWATPEVQANLSDINDLAFHYLFGNNDTRRIRGGPLIQDVWSNMNNVAQNKSAYKVKMYSAHDTTVSAVLAFLDMNYPHQPQYASALFVDLYQNGTDYYVKVEYLNVTDSKQTFSFVLNGCPNEFCPLATFTSIYQPRFPADAEKECAKNNPMPPMPDGNNKTLVIVLVIVILALATLVGVAFWCLHMRRLSHDQPLLGGLNSGTEA